MLNSFAPAHLAKFGDYFSTHFVLFFSAIEIRIKLNDDLSWSKAELVSNPTSAASRHLVEDSQIPRHLSGTHFRVQAGFLWVLPRANL